MPPLMSHRPPPIPPASTTGGFDPPSVPRTSLGPPALPRSAPSSPPSRPSPKSAPPPIPVGGSTPGFSLPRAGGARLSVIYQGEKFPVDKDRFVIGRGRQSSDLTLKDPNGSRQHAMVEQQNGVYFMVDMGSTNGVEYNGQRVARKPISEGDTFRICDHELIFTYA